MLTVSKVAITYWQGWDIKGRVAEEGSKAAGKEGGALTR